MSVTADTTLKVDVTTKFRRMPRTEALSQWSEQLSCDAKFGHVLQVQQCGVIKCRDCGAEWRDEGD